uniref:Uncharacterized protein n=1 Tax=Avena sativa TaxID=4498 RepID=A0ACD5VAF6_AVESA
MAVHFHDLSSEPARPGSKRAAPQHQIKRSQPLCGCQLNNKAGKPIYKLQAMNLVSGAMGSLLPKLIELVKDEYKLPKIVKEGVRSLEKEMKSMHAALRKVAEVPRDQLDEQVNLWAGEVRELSFDMEDVIDKFLVRAADDDDPDPAARSNKLKQLTEKMSGLFTKGKARHQISNAIKDINKQLQEVASRHGRYTVDNIVANPAAAVTTHIDPRLGALYAEVAQLVGIVGERDQEVIKLLSQGDSMPQKKLKMVSVVGFGGLGKTTLVRAVYDKIKGDFDCTAFVPAGRSADARKVFLEILLDLGIYQTHFTMFNERQLIDKLRKSLENKRYLIVIDDIWDKKLWTIINLAFSNDNNFGSRLITTTRIVSVSKLCCSSTNGSIYLMEPLSDDDSKRLFNKRIFSHEGECRRQFKEVSMDILRKCGGVPLAIITIASLLTSDLQVKHLDEWQALLESIGRGLTENPSVEEMLRILAFSYYDLPSHLKTCFLYLGMFPEDYKIIKDKLIWMWIAESFIQCEKEKNSLFEIGESYFNELVNRNMILPVYDDEVKVVACKVHDMVLDLIASLSNEDNFVFLQSGTSDSCRSSQSNVRRLSLQNAQEGEFQSSSLESISMIQVRSVALFEPAIGLMPSFSRFVVLRVLELNGCDLSDCNHLNLRELGSLLHLRYLGLGDTRISELPEEVGKLQFLQVLDLSKIHNVELPWTIIKLRRLIRLLIDCNIERLAEGLGNLTSMEVLREICIDSLSLVKELGSMERLRDLAIKFQSMRLELEDAFVQSLGKMSNIQVLRIQYRGDDVERRMDILGERWVPPRSLREFFMTRDLWFSTLPAWIRRNPSNVSSQLSKLQIKVEEVRQEDLDVFGMLPALRVLYLWSIRQSRLLLVAADGFRCLAFFKLGSDSPGQVVFQPGAMPKAERVDLRISLRAAKQEASRAASGKRGGYWFDLGMDSLASLREVEVTFFRSGVTFGDAMRAKDALKRALRAHHNQPYLDIYFKRDDGSDDNVYNSDEENIVSSCWGSLQDQIARPTVKSPRRRPFRRRRTEHRGQPSA